MSTENEPRFVFDPKTPSVFVGGVGTTTMAVFKPSTDGSALTQPESSARMRSDRMVCKSRNLPFEFWFDPFFDNKVDTVKRHMDAFYRDITTFNVHCFQSLNSWKEFEARSNSDCPVDPENTTTSLVLEATVNQLQELVEKQSTAFTRFENGKRVDH